MTCVWGHTGRHLSFKTNLNKIGGKESKKIPNQKCKNIANATIWKYLKNCSCSDCFNFVKLCKKNLKNFSASNYDEICNCCKNYWLCISERKLWIEEFYIKKIWKKCSCRKVTVVLVGAILKWFGKLLFSHNHCIFNIAERNYSDGII